MPPTRLAEVHRAQAQLRDGEPAVAAELRGLEHAVPFRLTLAMSQTFGKLAGRPPASPQCLSPKLYQALFGPSDEETFARPSETEPPVKVVAKLGHQPRRRNLTRR